MERYNSTPMERSFAACLSSADTGFTLTRWFGPSAVTPRRRSKTRLGIALLLAFAGCRDSSSSPPPKLNDSFVELYWVSPTQDADHAVQVRDRDGKIWYRAAKPVINLSHLEYETAGVDQGPNVTFVIGFQGFRRSGERDFARWTREHVGQSVGILVDGSLRVTRTCLGEIRSFAIGGYATREEAERDAEVIRAGGVKDSKGGNSPAWGPH